MGKLLKIGRVLEYLLLPTNRCSCFCMNTLHDDDEDELQKKLLVPSSSHNNGNLMRLKDFVSPQHTLAFHLKPKIVELRVSMHCNGCAKRVEKHISKIEGVKWYKVELESKKVVVMGNILPLEVLESVCKVKNAELWSS